MSSVAPLGGIDGRQAADKYRGALVGALVGDARGAPFEGHRCWISSRRIRRSEWQVGALPYTDDAAQTMVLAESLLEMGGVDQDHLAAALAEQWRREPHRGYGRGAARLLALIAAGEPWRSCADKQYGGLGSFGNGAAMRVSPVALHVAGDPVAAAELGRQTARVTHTHPTAMQAAGMQAAAVALALGAPTEGSIDRAAFLNGLRAVVDDRALTKRLNVVSALMERAPSYRISAWLGNGVAAREAVPAALCAFLRHPDSFVDAVRFALGIGGDTDTIASMTGAIAGARLGESSIPSSWLRRIEGVAKMQSLADRLADRCSASA